MKRPDGRIAKALGVAIAGAALLGACASSTPQDAPDWYLAHLQTADADKYPRLEDVPRDIAANMDAAHWDAETAELIAAAKALKAHPRAAAAEAVDPVAFNEAARAELEAARNAH